MTTPPDPTGVRRLVDAADNDNLWDNCTCNYGKHLDRCPYCKAKRELAEAAAAIRVAELERVVEAARKVPRMLGHASHWDSTGQHGAGCPQCIENSAIADELRQALAALDAKETT